MYFGFGVWALEFVCPWTLVKSRLDYIWVLEQEILVFLDFELSFKKYPGIAELVPRHIWDVEIVRSSRTTRTIIAL